MVYLILADGFEDLEAAAPIDIIRRADIPLQTVGLTGSWVVSARGVPMRADLALEDLSVESVLDSENPLEMLILPGGPGVDALRRNETLAQWVKVVVQAGRWLAAICAAPLVPGALGLLKGRHVTCFPGSTEEMVGFGALVETSPVVVDGSLVTGRAAGAALPFALKLVEALRGEALSRRIASQICYDGA